MSGSRNFTRGSSRHVKGLESTIPKIHYSEDIELG